LHPQKSGNAQSTLLMIERLTHCGCYFLRRTNASTTTPKPSKPSVEGSGTVAIFVVDKPTICCPGIAYALVATVSSVLASRLNLKRIFIGFYLAFP